VICLATVVFVSIVTLAACGHAVRLATCRRKFDGTFALDTFGGNVVLLINGPVSGLGESCMVTNWTSAVASFYSTGLLQCLRILTLYTCQCG